MENQGEPQQDYLGIGKQEMKDLEGRVRKYMEEAARKYGTTYPPISTKPRCISPTHVDLSPPVYKHLVEVEKSLKSASIISPDATLDDVVNILLSRDVILRLCQVFPPPVKIPTFGDIQEVDADALFWEE